MWFDASMAPLIWEAHFTFAGIDPREWRKKERLWKESALEVALLLSDGMSVGLRAETATGKTLIALLAAMALGARVVFLTHSRYLSHQHEELLRNVLGAKVPSRVITGETTPHKRVWDALEERFIFATADAFYAECVGETASPAMFDLAVFDEVHKARGHYAYVLLAPLFEAAGVPRLGLSASLGSTVPEVELVLFGAGLGRVRSFEGKVPYKIKDICFVKMTEELETADRLVWRALHEKFVYGLARAGAVFSPEKPPSAKELEEISEKLYAFPRSENNKRLVFRFAEYRKFLYAYRAFMTESYAAFLAYTERLKEDDERSSQALLSEPLMRRLMRTAAEELDRHPKTTELLRYLRPAARMRQRVLVFFADKATASYSRELLARNGIAAEKHFGGAGRSVRKQREAIAALKRGELTALCTTSVIREGVSVPEVDKVIDYSVAQTAIEWLQGAGRTGRIRPGYVAHFVLDHPLDRLTFFNVHRETERMEKLSKREREGASSSARAGETYSLFFGN